MKIIFPITSVLDPAVPRGMAREDIQPEFHKLIRNKEAEIRLPVQAVLTQGAMDQLFFLDPEIREIVKNARFAIDDEDQVAILKHCASVRGLNAREIQIWNHRGEKW